MKVYVLVNSGVLVGAYEDAGDMLEAAAEEIENGVRIRAENMDFDECSGIFSVSMDIDDLVCKTVEFNR